MQRSEGFLAGQYLNWTILCWVLGKGPLLASAEAVEIDRELSGHIDALHSIKFSEALAVLYLHPQG